MEDLSTAGQETAELDMQTVLDADGHDPTAPVDSSAGTDEEDLLEWDVPGGEGPETMPEVPGQERLSLE